MPYKLFGNRIPYKYFVTVGAGESTAGSEGLPYETGSYDAALNDAGIENVNVVKYTSVIATRAKEISKEAGLKSIQWGEAMECIMAQANGPKNGLISVGVIITNVSDPKGNHLGGFACEYSGTGNKEQAEISLSDSIRGMIERRGMGKFPSNKLHLYRDNVTDKGFIIHPGFKFAFKSLRVKQSHGTVLAAICFTQYQYPVLSSSVSSQKKSKKNRTRKKKSS
jgi:arginine decarboxylase